MNGTWLRNRPRHLLAILTVSAALGCVDLGSGELPDQVPIVTDSVETASQFNANQLLITNNLGFNARDAAATAFFNYASIKLEFYNTNSSLPDPMGSPGAPDWPDPFQDPGFYQTYANNHHAASTYRWVIFYVNHTVWNSSTACFFLAGISNPGPDNTVPTDPTQRWTFVFLTDIKQYEQTVCSPNATDDEWQNWVNHTVTHEYGHQRAGLTDDEGADAALYHTGRLPTGRKDVMVGDEAEYRGHRDAVFDSNGNEQKGDHTTCHGNLVTNQSVH